MMADGAARVLEDGRTSAGLTLPELWIRYFGLGGMSTPLELDAYLQGALLPTAHEYDVLAHAINERMVELGRNHPVPYSDS